MFQSMTDGPIWEKEFALLVDQEHFEKVWGIMLPNVEQYADSFLTSISNFGNQGVMEYAYSAFVQELIEKMINAQRNTMTFSTWIYSRTNMKWIKTISRIQR